MLFGVFCHRTCRNVIFFCHVLFLNSHNRRVTDSSCTVTPPAAAHQPSMKLGKLRFNLQLKWAGFLELHKFRWILIQLHWGTKQPINLEILPWFIVSPQLILAAAASEALDITGALFLRLLVLRCLNRHGDCHRPHLLRVLVHSDYLIDTLVLGHIQDSLRRVHAGDPHSSAHGAPLGPSGSAVSLPVLGGCNSSDACSLEASNLSRLKGTGRAWNAQRCSTLLRTPAMANKDPGGSKDALHGSPESPDPNPSLWRALKSSGACSGQRDAAWT